MGYDVHIKRPDKDPKTSDGEWAAYVASDTSMQLIGSVETKTPDGHTVRYENEGLAVWAGHSRKPWFDFRRGRVVVKNPDIEILKKMWLVAQALNAKVQGDDGETYAADGSVEHK